MMPNKIQLRENSKSSGTDGISYICYLTFNRWNDKRNVNCNRNDNDWNDNWWLSGVPQLSSFQQPRLTRGCVLSSKLAVPTSKHRTRFIEWNGKF